MRAYMRSRNERKDWNPRIPSLKAEAYRQKEERAYWQHIKSGQTSARCELSASNLKDEVALLETRRDLNQAVEGIWFLVGSFTNQNTPAAAATAAAPNITTMIWKLLA
jgi:hypothetical protein